MFIKKYLHWIVGNDQLKRALEVAEASKQSLLMIGAPDTQGEKICEDLKDNKDGVEVYFAYPCPCGYLGHPEKACSCTPNEVRKHRAKIPKADMRVNIYRPHWEAVEKHLPQIDMRIGNPEILDLLKKVYQVKKLSVEDVGTLLRRTSAITKLSKESQMKPRHLAEAIQYGNFWDE